ncbi:MAG: oligoendopeptidase F [Deltaproteobacteria bacterium]|nr:oligoendopeptidase F [Deltaproteobacteria bacterium]
MNRISLSFFVFIIAIILIAAYQQGGPIMKKGEIKERSEIDSKYKWDLTHLYKNIEEWRKDKDFILNNLKEFEKYKGKLKKTEDIKKVLDLYFKLMHKLYRISGYAMMSYDQDTRVSETLALKSIAEKVSADFGEATAFIEPELISLPEATIKKLISHKDFKDYDMFLKNLLRKKSHILSRKEEELLARTATFASAGYNIYSAFTGGELNFPEVELSTKEKVQLNQANYTKYRESTIRSDREKIFVEFFSTYMKYKNTLAQSLASQIDANIFYAKTRRYKSALEASIFYENIPVELYENLIKMINENLNVLHRYLILKKEILGLSELRYYDLYAPITTGIQDTYSYEEAVKIAGETLKPMGDEYVKIAIEALSPGSGWTDVYPNRGKRSGAYMTGDHYDVHPYMLLNYNDNYNSVSTMLHELGHAMHSYYSNKTQPFAKANYPIFVAEVASTFNENLLLNYMLSKEKDITKRKILLGESLETMRTTVFRQAMFSEFEYNIYKSAENKEPITADFLNKTYLELLKKYYGDSKGVVKIDDLYAVEWAYVPHFYYNFYVYKYVTGYIAALYLSERVLREGENARKEYVENLLKGGFSDYPLELLRRSGADMMSKEPYEEAFNIFTRRIEELEKLVKR